MTGKVRPAAQGPLEIQTLPAMTAMRKSCFCSIPCKLSESSYMELKGHFFPGMHARHPGKTRSHPLESAIGSLFP